MNEQFNNKKTESLASSEEQAPVPVAPIPITQSTNE